MKNSTRREPPEVFPSKKQFHFWPSLTDAQLWSIGMVVAEWQMIELQMQSHVFQLAENDPDVQKMFRETRTFEARRDQWKELVTRREPEPLRTEFLMVIDVIGSVKLDRDRIIHGYMVGGDSNEDGQPVHQTGMSFERSATPRRNFEWRHSTERLKRTIVKLDMINLRLFELFGGGT